VADAKMRMFNADGSEGKMCGNAIRCVAKYVYDNGIARKTTLKIETLSGVKTIYVNVKNGSVYSARVDMGKPELIPSKIPVSFDGDAVINAPIIVDNKKHNITCVSMGNPHAVLFCNDLDKLDMAKIGPKFENYPQFPEKINTEFVKVVDSKTLKMRVWERGSGETLACGTGACASVVAAVLNGYCKKNEDIRVILLGGELTVKYTDEAVYMTGNCVKVFEGVIEL
ncbi:MAG: diaminopimelate epimerase, partial [Clostridia bacterium]|nr:diaminopimelate epimerase [Clostridia bacterium]